MPRLSASRACVVSRCLFVESAYVDIPRGIKCETHQSRVLSVDASRAFGSYPRFGQSRQPRARAEYHGRDIPVFPQVKKHPGFRELGLTLRLLFSQVCRSR